MPALYQQEIGEKTMFCVRTMLPTMALAAITTGMVYAGLMVLMLQ